MARVPITILVALAALSPALAHADEAPAHRPWSTIPAGPYAILPATPENFTASDGVHISYAVHMPAVPAGTRVPVILTAGPYFALEEEPVHVPSTVRLSGFLIENFVPHGYAVVAASVRGSGWSGGCMELMSEREGRDIDELVSFLATREWSAGVVGMIGKSYDGSVAWNVARFGNPVLKTIVPIAGISDVAEYHSTHGVSSPTMPLYHTVVYYPYGFGYGGVGGSIGAENPGRAPLDRAANLACPEHVESLAAGSWTAATGDAETVPGATDYWRERDFRPGVIANYRGSVFIVHGLRDWNVLPHQTMPLFTELPQEKKMWLGQWEHHYPDEGQRTNRADFAATLKAWFDRSLKGMAVDTGPAVEVADGRTNAWHAYPEWPSTSVPPLELAFRADGSLGAGPQDPFQRAIASTATNTACYPPGKLPLPNGARLDMPTHAYFKTAAASTFVLSGLVTADVELEAATAGAVTASLCVDGFPVDVAAASLSNAAGGGALQPYAPGLPLRVRVTFEPIERTVLAGEEIGVSISFGTPLAPTLGMNAGVLRGGSLTLPIAP